MPAAFGLFSTSFSRVFLLSSDVVPPSFACGLFFLSASLSKVSLRFFASSALLLKDLTS
jgi:hypothetical protein